MLRARLTINGHWVIKRGTMKASTHHTVNTIRYTYHELRLLQEQVELQKAIIAAETQLKHLLDGLGKDSLSGITSEEQVLVHRAGICRERLKRVQQGLRRIRDGTFGMCSNCENPIGNTRLHAIPSTPYCIECQSNFERRRAGVYIR